MELSPNYIFIETLKGLWLFKDFYLMVGGILLLVLTARVVIDLLNKKSKIKWFLGKKKAQELQRLTPGEFENYIEELFRSLGYTTKTVGGRGDGGVDVEAEKDGLVHYIQCKKFVNSKVPVGAVRDFYGAIADRVDGGKGYFITTSVFTLDAEKFAEDKPIELVDKFKLMEYMRMANTDVPESKPMVCPECGGMLIERNGRYGKFMGCSNYPKCKFTQQI